MQFQRIVLLAAGLSGVFASPRLKILGRRIKIIEGNNSD